MNTPKLRDTCSGKDLGYVNREHYVYAQCPSCGKECWRQQKCVDKLCVKCSKIDQSIKAHNKLGLVYKRTNIGIRYQDACLKCGKTLWRRRQYLGHLCRNCSAILTGHRGINNNRWKGGKLLTRFGYIEVKAYPDNPYYPMANRHGYIPEHRLVIAQHLGRCLAKWEVVHHKNGIKTDNHLENLELVLQAKNVAYSLQTQTLVERVGELEKQVRLLKFQIKTLRQGNPELGNSLFPSVETLHETPHVGEEKVRAFQK